MRYRGIFTVGFIILIWWVASLAFDLQAIFLPTVGETFAATIKEMSNGHFITHVTATLSRVGLGLSVAGLLAAIFALACAFAPNTTKTLSGTFDFLRSIPTPMLFPVFIIFFGIGELSRIAIVSYVSTPVLFIGLLKLLPSNSTGGSTHEYQLIHKYDISTRDLLFWRIAEATAPVATSLKVAISLSLVIVSVTEMFFVSSTGVGYAANRAYLSFNMGTMFVYIISIGIIGLILNRFFDWLVDVTAT